MKFLNKKTGIAVKILLIMTVVAALCAISTAALAADLEMSTEFPGRSVKVGETVKVALDFINNTDNGDRVELSVLEAPEGWDWYFAGDDNLINAVYVKSGNNLLLADFNITVPADAEKGTYDVKLKAQGTSLSSTLDLKLTVDDATMGSSTIVTEYPRQEGYGGKEYSFYTTIRNNTLSTQSYSFTTDAPEDWDIKFMPADEVAIVAGIEIESGKSQKMYVSLTPPEDVAAGEYTINVAAESDSETLRTVFYVEVRETYELEVTTPDGRLSFDAVAGKETPVTLKINNNSNIAVENVNLSSNVSTDWRVIFSESVISSIAPGESVEITAYVTPSENALAGDYVSIITASADESSAEASFRVSVKTDTTWGLVGVLMILVIVAGLWFVFRKFGRR